MGGILIIVFLLTLAIGVPVFISMGLAALLAFLENGSIPLTQLPRLMFSGINSFPLMAIPLFILAAEIMTEGKLIDRLIRVCNDFLGHITGGLGHVNVVMSMIFGGISGSSVADAAGTGKLEMFMMRKAGYDPFYSGAMTASSAVMGIIIPPSIPMVIYALSNGKTSTMGLFAAGYIPGILMGLSLMTVNAVISAKRNYRFNLKHIPFSQKMKSLWHSMPGLIMPVLIIVCTVFGITTPTEAAALAVAYAIIAGFIITRTMSLKLFAEVLYKSAVTSAAILMIVSMGSVFSWVLTYAKIPQSVGAWIGTLTTNPTVFLLLTALLVIITGMFVDTIPAVMILAPVVSPIAAHFGINPFQMGLVVVVGIGIGMLTPPVAPLLFITSSIGKLNLEKLIKSTIPMILAEVSVLLAIIFIPELTTWLPALFGYSR
ncbi:MAG: TRAP transporter large permease [Eubacteriales bacterium]|nr:TRAP transporter large permease [Eubacteriales bacterium]